jgi:two-component system, cell cycle sensor histidine kinase and response regulator CckA
MAVVLNMRQDEGANAGRGKTAIWIVEDFAPIRELIASALKPRGYNLTFFSSADDVVRKSSEQIAALELLITDVSIGELNGYGLAEQLRVHNPSLRVLFISGTIAPQAETRECPQPGTMTGYLEKPFSVQDFLGCIEKMLELPVA